MIPMKKKLILLVALLSAISVVAMDHTKEIPPGKEVFRNEEETLVKICLTDSANSETSHAVEIPIRLAKLMGALNNDLLEDPNTKGSVFPLPNMALAEWQSVESQLERVYSITHDEINAVQLRKEIIAEYAKLDAKNLIELILALDYADIPLLLEIACNEAKKSDLGRFSFEQINSLPEDMGNRIILDNVLRLGGPMFAKELAVCRGHEGLVKSVCVTKDGRIVSGSADCTVRVCDIQGNQLAVHRGHKNLVSSVCVMEDGTIISGSFDKTVRVWDMHIQLAACLGHEDWVTSVYVTKDDKIVSGSNDKTVRVWDMQGHQFAECRGHENLVNSVFVTKESKIVSGADDKTIRVWDMQGNQLAVCRGHQGIVWSVCVTQDGKIVSGSYDKSVRVWDMQGKQLGVWKGHEGMVYRVCVTEDGKIVSGSWDNTMRVWDMEGNQLAVCRGHQGIVWSVCVTQDGKIVSGSEDRTVRVWDMQGNQLAECRGHQDVVKSVCVTQDGMIVSGSHDTSVRAWDIELLGRIVHMDEDQARVLWELLHNISQKAKLGKQELWKEVEKILGGGAQVAHAIVNNNNE